MKKYLLYICLAAGSLRAGAQPWVPAGNKQPLRMADAMARYPRYAPVAAEREEEEEERREAKRHKHSRVVKEDKDHLYHKWKWYWSQHLDDRGYMVSPMRGLKEWVRSSTVAKAAAKTTAVPSNWVFQGPQQSTGGYAGLGRINVVAFDPVDSNTLYIGSAAGSTWKSADRGNTWSVMYDNLPTLGVSDIKINPKNHNEIYVATGDGDAGDAYSSGVIRSVDGGATWAIAGISWAPTAYNNARSILINPVDTNTLILGSNNGIYISHNAGTSWTNIPAGDFKQILYNPADTSIVYGAVYSDTSAQIVRSVDGGVTWSSVTSFTDAQRVCLAVCPGAPGNVKAIVSNNQSGLKGVYVSTDAGATFSAVFADDATCANNLLGYDLGLPASSCGGQAWYDLCIAMDPVDPNKVTIGGVNNYSSLDGGITWQLVTQWYSGITGVQTVHADKHFLGYNPLNRALYEGCDGGVYRTYEPVTGEWTDLTNGIGITEFYRNAVDNNVTFCIGGAQDNGTKSMDMGMATDLTGGDGMQPLINYGDPANVFYCAYQSGSIDMTRDGGASFHNITDVLGASGDWISPYVIHPTDTASLLLAYKCVYLTTDNGNSWMPLSPTWDTSYNINYMAISHKNPNYIYTVTSDYNAWVSVIHYTTDYGTTWNTLAHPFTRFISDITVDPKIPTKIYVTISGYGDGKVYWYDLAAPSWHNISGTLPDLPVDCILVDSITRTTYIGTDAAVYYRDTLMSDWALFNNHLPSVHVTDLNINYTTNEVWAATFGRGMWKSVRADKPVGVPVQQLTADALSVAPNPSHGVFVLHTTGMQLRTGQVMIKLMNAAGKVVREQQAAFDASDALRMDVKGIPAGVYICEVSNSQMVSRCRVAIY